MIKFGAKGVERPGRAAAAKEIIVAREDAGIQCRGKSDRWPIVGIARDTPSRRGFQVMVHMSRDNFDRVVVDKRLDFLVNQ
ncbi:MAG: hypothetical protein M3Q50_09045 [Chloroflexota bacterium]|nr:hypothetical protein [Chloroflexota bacterium]